MITDSHNLTIGAVSSATGIPVTTLRTWERRYGLCLESARSPGGHRLYTQHSVEHLHLIHKALEQGHKISRVAGRSFEELGELTSLDDDPSQGLMAQERGERDATLEVWFTFVKAYDQPALQGALERAWFVQGSLPMIHHYLGSFIDQVGERWAKGEISVAQEHFCSELIVAFLTRQWKLLSDRSMGPRVLCTTLPGERHILGLHMAATVMALGGCKVTFLGADTPMDALVETIVHIDDLATVLISASQASHHDEVNRNLLKLQESLADRATCPVIVGGGGAPEQPAYGRRIDTLEQLASWAPKLFTNTAPDLSWGSPASYSNT